MFYRFWLENEAGKTIEFNQLGGPYSIVEIQGLSPAPAQINTSQMALLDGEKFNSAKVKMRTLNVAFAIETKAAQRRVDVYSILRTKSPVNAYYRSETRNVFIAGYIESIDVAHFENKQVVTVSILCPAPFWKNAQEAVNEMRTVLCGFHFPFCSPDEPVLIMGTIQDFVQAAIVNNGDVQTGLTIELYASGEIINPKIWDYFTYQFLALDFTMHAGDLITITTGQGNKTITLLRDGVTTNIFNTFAEGSTWLQLPPDGTVFTYEVEEGAASALEIFIRHYDLYEGV